MAAAHVKYAFPDWMIVLQLEELWSFGSLSDQGERASYPPEIDLGAKCLSTQLAELRIPCLSPQLLRAAQQPAISARADGGIVRDAVCCQRLASCCW